MKKVYERIKYMFDKNEEPDDPIEKYWARRGSIPEDDLVFWDFFVTNLYADYPQLKNPNVILDGSIMEKKEYSNSLIDDFLGVNRNDVSFNDNFTDLKSQRNNSLFLKNYSKETENSSDLSRNNPPDGSFLVLKNNNEYFNTSSLEIPTNFSWKTNLTLNDIVNGSSKNNFKNLENKNNVHSYDTNSTGILISVNDTKGIKSFFCDEPNCNKKYTSKHGLDYHTMHGHLKTNSNVVKPYQCNYYGCSSSYKSRNGLTYHLEKNHQKKD